MRNFLIGMAVSPIVFGIALGLWLLVFDAMERQAVIYQECGGKYCPLTEVDNDQN